MIVFGSIFLLVGLGTFWGLFVGPMLQAFSARNWPEAPCVILASEVKTNRDSDGDTYSPELRYRFPMDGKDLESTRYGFMKISGSHRWAKEIIERYPVGSNTVCYYNPQRPDQAVLNRNLGWSILFGLIPLVFVIVGGGIVFATIFGYRISNKSISGMANIKSQSGEAISFVDDDARFEGPQKLKPTISRFAKFVVISFFMLFWNGIVSVFLVQVIRVPQIFLILFLIPFVAAGLGLIVGTFYTLMAMTNPRVEVALSNGAVPLGESIDVAWQLYGRTGRIRRLKLWIEGTEQATYTRGTSTYTDKSVFMSIPLVESEASNEIQFGTQTIQIPRETMHTLHGDKNKILWQIRLRGTIPWWPDIDEIFEFCVKPIQRT